MLRKVFVTPFRKFVSIESFSGILLLTVTLIALIWANSPLGDSYRALWQHKIGFSAGSFALNKPLLLWINDGFMAIFFFLIGLEVKREFLIGELNTPKKIAFPLLGALGGMLIPVLIFLLLNRDPSASQGWGIPMATDIAFSLAILNTLGKRVPFSLSLFLTAFAIVDDIGAVVIIAIFYSGSIHLGFLMAAIVLLGVIYLLTVKGYFSNFFILLMGSIVWFLFLKSGFHPTIAGILLAFAVPVRQKTNTPEFLQRLDNITRNIQKANVSEKPILCKEQIEQIDSLEDLIDTYQSPLQGLEHKLHGWVAYFIIPLFALANAGVVFTGNTELNSPLISTLMLCLIFGKSIGITTLILLARKLRIIAIPEEISTLQVIGVSFLAGVGFTMAIFIAGLAFPENEVLLSSAKVGILSGSFIAGLIGFVVLRVSSGKESDVRNT